MALNRGMAVSKDVGVFLNASHLLALDRSQRKPAPILDWVGVSTTRLLTGGSVSHQVIVADCANFEERRVADEFSLQAGFRVRHVPAGGPTSTAVLSAEILSAAGTDPELRVVVVGDDLTSQEPVFDALHHMKRWVVLLSKDWSQSSRHADLVIDLPLNRDDLFMAIGEVADRLGSEPDAITLNREVRKLIPGFRPQVFGFDNMAAVMRAAKTVGKSAKSRPVGTSSTTKGAAPGTTGPDSESPGRKRTRPGADPERVSMRKKLFSLTPLADATGMADLTIASHLLEALSAQQFHDFVSRRGLDPAMFVDGIRHLVSDPRWKPDNTADGLPKPFGQLMFQAVEEAPGWVVGLPPGQHTSAVLKAPELPGDWSPWIPGIVVGPDAEAADEQPDQSADAG